MSAIIVANLPLKKMGPARESQQINAAAYVIVLIDSSYCCLIFSASSTQSA